MPEPLKVPSLSPKALEEESFSRREGVNPLPINLSSSRGEAAALARLREAAAALRAAGVENADECLRLGAAVMAERCLAKYRARQPEVGPGWLAAAIRQGDGFPSLPAERRRENASDWLRVINGGA